MTHNRQIRLGLQAILPVCVGAPLVVAAMTGFVLRAQTAAFSRPTFEVASIRPSKDCDGGGQKGGPKVAELVRGG
jgi:hypothetical protein